LPIIFSLDPAADGTCVVILADSKQIVVAADSKIGNSPEHKLCKIFKVGSVYWAMSGLVSKHVAGYDVAAIVQESYRPGRSVADTLKSFDKNVTIPLVKALEYLRISPKEFEQIRYHPLEIAFWAIEDGKPVVAHVFYTTEVAGNTISLRTSEEIIVDCRKENCSTITRATFLGGREDILKYLPQHPEWTSDLAHTAQLLVDVSVHEAPQAVGYPITEIAVSLDGKYRWVSLNEYCHHGRLLAGPLP